MGFAQKFFSALKQKAEEVTILPFLPKARVPLAVKAGLASLLIPGAAPRALKGALTLGKAIIPRTPKQIFLTATGIGVLQTSPKAVQFVKEKIRDPTGTGKAIGAIIEDPSTLQPDIGQTTTGKIKEVAKAAGIVGGVAAAAAAIPGVIKKVRGKSDVFVGQPSAVPVPQFQSIGTAKREEPIKEVPPKPVMPTINNKISVKPIINVRVSQNRKFINQQLLVKPHACT